ncbi:MAG TPA: cytochrome c [Bryobacteraceae bacterium]|nr:cytochrome c [Bryobacteraceae bacterium]
MIRKILIAGASIAIALAWAEPSVWDGVYSSAQAKRGQTLYAKSCASCHRADLEGHGPTPSLAGSEFRDRWDGQTLGDLFEKTQATMPGDHPGSLSREDNAAILAFILQSNEMPAGEKDLPTDGDSLAKIRFTAAKPSR